MMRKKLLILVMLMAATPALAEDRPAMRPSRDVAVEYRSGGMPEAPAAEPEKLVMMRFASKSGKIRIDGPGGRGYAIIDVDAGRMTMVMTERNMYMERPADPGMLAMFQANNSAFTKTGSDTVAGVACTTYDGTIKDHRGQVCLTDDGVLLRARSEDPDRHRQLEAVTVTYEDQPVALFEVPAGFQKLDMTNMPHGMNMGPSGAGNPGGQPGR